MHAHEIRIQPATSCSITWQLLSCVQSLERNRDLLLWIFAHQNDARARSDIKVLYFGMDTKSLNTYFRELMQCSSASSVFFSINMKTLNKMTLNFNEWSQDPGTGMLWYCHSHADKARQPFYYPEQTTLHLLFKCT